MKINQQYRFCRYCEEVLPTYLTKNVWYHEECLTESKRERSNKYYKDNLNDSLLGGGVLIYIGYKTYRYFKPNDTNKH